MFGARFAALLAVMALLAGSLPSVPGASATRPGLGVDVDGAATLAKLGARPDFASFWVGPWMATYGWGGLDGALASARGSGATPLVYWYYWGDDISPGCVEGGCAGKSRAQWDDMTQTLVARLQADLAGGPAVVVLENEFNKNGIDASSYAPTFDGYLAAKVAALHAVPSVRVVLGFGGWGEANWARFPSAIAASDLVGFQAMRGSTQDTAASYAAAPDRIGQLVNASQAMGAKGSFLYDLALSSYPDASGEALQNATLAAILSRAPAWGQVGLAGIVYRSVDDNPSMSPSNYYGYAEQHWGLRDSAGSPKAAFATWLAAMGGNAPSPSPRATPPSNATPPSPPQAPGSFEAEAMQASAGGREADASASGGAVWNLWSNGTLSQTFQASAGSYQILVTARGTPAAGGWPVMQATVGGVLLGNLTVSSPASATYAFRATLAGGTATLALAFVNDLQTATEDRNLIVDVVNVSVTPAPRPPVASFLTTPSNMTVSFDASSSSDPEGGPLSYAWSFGDGTTGAGMRVAHAYATPGRYLATLNVTSANAWALANATVSPTQPPPVAAFQMTGANLTWRFDASNSSSPSGAALSYQWSFGDGATAAGVASTHTYAAPGSYRVSLTLTDGRASSNATAQVQATTPPPFAATFSTNGGNDWWLATRVSANEALQGVCAVVNGSACLPLKLQSWGEWAASYHAPAGSRVVFVATGASGRTVASQAYFWTSGAPWANATFSGVTGNNWWVQVTVAATQPGVSVCASVNGGACQALQLQSWGGWAASIHAPTGATVVFRAAFSGAQTLASAPYSWSSKV